jgi:hypothetical protein
MNEVQSVCPVIAFLATTTPLPDAKKAVSAETSG